MQNYQSLMSAELGREEAGEKWEKSFGLEEKLYELQKQKAAQGGNGYAPPTSFREWQLAGQPGTFEQWLGKGPATVPTTEDFVNVFQPFKSGGYSREEVEKQYKAENKIGEDEELPAVVSQALDQVFGKKKGFWDWLKFWD